MAPAADLQTLLENMDKDFSGLKPLKVAVLADGASQFLCRALRAAGYDAGYALDVQGLDYLGLQRAVADQECELYRLKPDFLIVCPGFPQIRREFYLLDEKSKAGYGEGKASQIESLAAAVLERCGTKTVVCTVPSFNDGVFGNYALKAPASLPRQLLELNSRLSASAQERGALLLCDAQSLALEAGAAAVIDPRLYANADMAYAPDFLPSLAQALSAIMAAADGRFKKCLVLDLDNTIWGGVIGDDGLDNIQLGSLGLGKVYVELQLFFKQLKERGIILAVCSKNTERLAKEPFEKHPDMVLRLNDIALFTANWDDKASNLAAMRKTLNIGLDSMVFLDDNPVERAQVRKNLPGICVPELPEDPAEWLGYLAQANLFETASFSAEDAARTRQYQQEAARNAMKASCSDESEFLSSLKMEAVVKPLDEFSVPRVAQLTQRTNQFNLRSIRYTADDISVMRSATGVTCLTFALRDTLGDSGLVSALILRDIGGGTLFFDTWVMSCRVFKRTLEEFILNYAAAFAAQKGFQRLVGEYLPTPKNEFVRDLYPRLGFKPVGEHWELPLTSVSRLRTFVKEANHGNAANS